MPQLKTSKIIDKPRHFSSVELSITPFHMENAIKRTGQGMSVLGALAVTVAQGADIEQLKRQFEQQLAQAPDAVTQVLQSGEGCDGALLNQALETDNHDDYLICSALKTTRAEIELAKTQQRLEQEENEIADLSKKEQTLDNTLEQQKTDIESLSQREKTAEDSLLTSILTQ